MLRDYCIGLLSEVRNTIPLLRDINNFGSSLFGVGKGGRMGAIL